MFLYTFQMELRDPHYYSKCVETDIAVVTMVTVDVFASDIYSARRAVAALDIRNYTATDVESYNDVPEDD